MYLAGRYLCRFKTWIRALSLAAAQWAMPYEPAPRPRPWRHPFLNQTLLDSH